MDVRPDTIVPNPGNPQALNRYSYVLNNPIKYVDPSGHCALLEEDADGLCVRTARDGSPRVVHGGSVFVNPVEAALANAVFSGDPIYLSGIPAGISTLALQASVKSVAANNSGAAQFLFDPMLVAGLGMVFAKGVSSGVSSLFNAISKLPGAWLDYVPPKYQTSVAGSFAGKQVAGVTNTDIVVYRHWGGGADETGSPWFSTKPYANPSNAQRYLALPSKNSAQNISVFKIPSGTTVILGKVAPQTSYFGPHAIGGGTQIYLPNPNNAILLGPLTVTGQ